MKLKRKSVKKEREKILTCIFENAHGSASYSKLIILGYSNFACPYNLIFGRKYFIIITSSVTPENKGWIVR